MAPPAPFFNVSFVIQTNDSERNKNVKWHNYSHVKRHAALVRHSKQRLTTGNSRRSISTQHPKRIRRKPRIDSNLQADKTFCENRMPLAEPILSIRTTSRTDFGHSADNRPVLVLSPSSSSSPLSRDSSIGSNSTHSANSDTRADHDRNLSLDTENAQRNGANLYTTVQDENWSWETDKNLTATDFTLSVQRFCSKLPICKPVIGTGSAFDPFGLMHGDSGHNSSSSYEFLYCLGHRSVGGVNQEFGIASLWSDWLIIRSLTCRPLFHSIVATWQSSTSELFRERSLEADSLAHRVKAIAGLREILQQPNAEADDTAILTIIFLAFAELATLNNRVFEIHRKQVRQMVRSRGGLRRLSPELALPATFVLGTSWADVDPYKPAAIFPVDTTSPLPCLLEELPRGFQCLRLCHAISKPTLRIVERVANKRAGQDADISKQFLHEQCPGIFTPDTPDGEPALERLICLALLRYCINSIKVNRACLKGCQFSRFIFELAELLPLLNPNKFTTQCQKDCLLWVWLMAIDSYSADSHGLYPEGVDLLVQMRDKYPQTMEWEHSDFADVGGNFLWNENIEGILKNYWPALRIAWPEPYQSYHCDDSGRVDVESSVDLFSDLLSDQFRSRFAFFVHL